MSKKTTKRALAMSFVSVFLCVCMLVGTTFAWFTDEAKTGMNQIVAGNLDVALVDASGNSIEGNTKLFTQPGLWEPGAVAYAQLKVVNNGNLDLKYNMSINYEDVNSVDGRVLSEVLQYAIIDLPANPTRENVLAAAKASTNKGDLASYAYEHVLYAKDNADPDAGKHFQSDLQTLVIFWEPNANNVDNLYNVTKDKQTSDGNPLQINLGVKVVATQVGGGDHEQDSFGPDYDLNAPTLITIDGDATGTVYTDLATALEAAPDGATLYLSGAAELNYEVNSGVLETKATIVGKDETAVVVFTGLGTGSVSVSLKDLAVVDQTCYRAEDGENAWEFTYLELTGTNTFENVVFTDGIMVDGNANVTFTNCEFYGHNNDSSEYGNTTMYGAWVLSGTAKFNGCEFYGTRGLKVCDSNTSNTYASANVDVTVDGCTFDSLSEKPGLAIDYSGDASITFAVTIQNSEFINCQPGDQGLYIYETDNYVPTLNNNKVHATVSTAAELQAALDKALPGTVIKLAPGEYHGTFTAKSNLTIEGSKGAVVDCINLNGAENLTLKDITFDAAGAGRGYDGNGTARQYANIISGDVNKVGKGARNLMIDGCTFTGMFANDGAAVAFTDRGRTSGQSGDITIKNCTFKTTGSFYDIYTYYSGYGYLKIENNTFESDCQGRPVYLGRYQSSTPVVVDGNNFANVATFEDAASLQDHSSYGVSFATTNVNTFGG